MVGVQAEGLEVLQQDAAVTVTMPLGRPMVPEDNTTHRGRLNGNGVQASSSVRVAASSHGTASDGYVCDGQGRPTWFTNTVTFSVGSARASSGVASRRSWVVRSAAAR